MKRKKKRMAAWVRPESHEAFKGAVLAKWGKIHGAFGDELSDAMNHHANNHLSHPVRTRTHVDIADKGLKTAERVFARIRRTHEKEFTSGILNAAIRAEAGTDQRTIEKYTTVLVDDLGWIAIKVRGDFALKGSFKHPTIYSIARKPTSELGGRK